MSKKVAIVRELVLGFSETFIYAQTLHYKEFSAKFFGVDRSNNPILEHIACFWINRGSIIGKIQSVIYKLTGVSPQLKKELTKYNPDIIHVHYGTDAARALNVLKKLNKPIIVTFHGYDANTTDEWKISTGVILFRNYVKKRKELIKRVQCFCAVSEFVKSKLIGQGYPESKIKVCPIGIDLKMFNYDPEIPRKQRVLFVGRICENKGLRYLIDAMATIQSDKPEIELVIVGDGPLMEDMKQLASLTLKNYKFLGAITHREVKDLMSSAKVFCVPTIELPSGEAESFGLVFAEAQAMGTPVVSFKTGGIPEAVIDGKTGFLCNQKHPEELEKYIKVLFENETLWLSFSRNGRSHITQKFNIKNTTKQLEDIYIQVVNDFSIVV